MRKVEIKIGLRREAPLVDKKQTPNEETDEIKNEIQTGTQLSWNRGREIAEVELVLMPAFREKFRSPVQRPVRVRLHNFQFLRNAQAASPRGIPVGGRFPHHSPFDVKRDVLIFQRPYIVQSPPPPVPNGRTPYGAYLRPFPSPFLT